MIVQLSAKHNKPQIKKQLEKLSKGKRFNAYQHLGKLDWGQDALEYQRELRAE